MTTPAYTRDVMVIPVLRDIRRCAAEQLAMAGRQPCRFPITWGNSLPPADACDCFCTEGQGQAWVRWTETKPANIGGSGGAMPSECVSGLMEFSVEIGVYRCWRVPEGGPLDEGEEELAALGMLLDAAALRRALVCCPALEDREWEMERAEPLENQGGCTGVTITATVQGLDCDCSSYMPPMTPLHSN